MHIAEAQSSNPGIPLKYSGRINNRFFVVVTLCVDTVPKNVFIKVQHSHGGEEILNSKITVDRDIKST